ncbi:caspase recruitment domain-containing protein 18-like [Diceros bicornis minor]|uniref:caspase recruitment domain-containing protein 18-like n=1 Tax=Diceros bicornis minor TaxID=77932 RepID=UPI0026F26B90|nr:caspase recruitment domain-containing protein 18-like [Diceros bicornis minor]
MAGEPARVRSEVVGKKQIRKGLPSSLGLLKVYVNNFEMEGEMGGGKEGAQPDFHSIFEIKDNVLSKKRRLFIHSVGTGTINALLDDLLEDGVIRQEEMNKVRYENDTVMYQARVLIDLVIGKGSRACQKFIMYLREEDPELAWKMRLHSSKVQ